MPDVQEVFRMATQKVRPDPGALERQFREQRRRSTRRKIGAVVVSAAMIGAVAVFAITSRPNAPRNDRSGGTGSPTTGVISTAIVEIDGTVRADLELPADAWMAELSPDGTDVFFLTASTRIGNCGNCQPGTRTERLAMMPVGGSDFDGAYVYFENMPGVPRIGSHPVIEHPTLSPDGTRLAFVGVRTDGDRDIYVATLSPSAGPNETITARAIRLTTDPAVDTFPAWSPDGSTIYYENAGTEPLDDSGFSSTQEIWSVPAVGGTPTRLTDNAVADSQPDVSADGTVAFWRAGDVWTMRPDGNDQQTLDAVPLDLGFNPRWSPDGTMLAMLVYGDGRAHLDPELGRPTDLPLLEVVVLDVETGEIHDVGAQVASDVNPPSWTPDGALLINRYVRG